MAHEELAAGGDDSVRQRPEASSPASIAFPPIGRHGVIGDRRTGALVAADGTLDWFCAPDFDGPPVFGALLDPANGGFCRLGPVAPTFGKQHYLPNTMTLVTAWRGDVIALADTMGWPMADPPSGAHGQRVIIRRLRVATATDVRFDLQPRKNFSASPEAMRPADRGGAFLFGADCLGFWTSFPTNPRADGATATIALPAKSESWVVIGWNLRPEEWSAPRAAQVFAEAETYWRDWSADLRVEDAGSREAELRRSALTVQVLSHAHHHSAVAALTTSLPERIGGDRNYDYRYAWVRDASLSLALLARMGKVGEVKHYLDWLCGLESTTDSPLQVCYRLDGNPRIEQEEVEGVCGYENSRPVLRGNRAAKQMQLGSMGFFADCARIYLDHGGEWREEFWTLLKRAADFTCEHWQEKDCGVWELPHEAHYVASRVMSWVILERAVYIAEKTGHAPETDHWRQTAAAIHAEVMEQGWCDQQNAFRQHYDSVTLDAAALLIPLMEFLPVDHPRVVSTIAALERELVVGGLMHRFNPVAMPGGSDLSVGQFEGAFLPCVFWHAHTLAKAGRCDEAEAILLRCEAIAGEVGLFAEEVDARNDTFLGNTPQLFSHVEYVRAVTALNQARARATE